MKRLCALALVCAALWLAGCGGASVRLTYSGAADEESTDYAALNRRGYNYQHGIGTAADIERPWNATPQRRNMESRRP